MKSNARSNDQMNEIGIVYVLNSKKEVSRFQIFLLQNIHGFFCLCLSTLIKWELCSTGIFIRRNVLYALN